MYLNIKCNSEIQIEALTLVGASTKRFDDSKIGQFGTGNKFALAYLLRNGYKLRIFSGEKEFEITTVEKALRDVIYDVIVIAGQETSITTQMGKDWNLWQALREIYCNAMDEGCEEIRYQHDVTPKEGETHFYIKKTDEIDEFFFKNFDWFFSKYKKVLFENKYGQVLEKTGEKACIYRKGVCCHETDYPSLYDYNFFDVTINEDRMLRYSWELSRYIYRLLLACDNEEIIKNILMNNHNMLEAVCDCSIDSLEVSGTFIDVVKTLKLVPWNMYGYLQPEERIQFATISSYLFDKLKPYLSNDNLGNNFKPYVNGIYRDYEPSEDEQTILEGAVQWFRNVDFHIPYLIKTAIFERKDTLGSVSQDSILISETCISEGIDCVVKTIMEEFIHIKYGCSDETRTFQNSIINEFFSYMKKKSPN